MPRRLRPWLCWFLESATRNAGAAVAAAAVFAGFVVAKGVPTLRHDWTWPVDAQAIPSFFQEATGGWLPVGFGIAAPHPTTYLIGIPIAIAMSIAGTLAALAVFAFALAYCCAGAAQGVGLRCGSGTIGAAGIGVFALFNPWVYNEVVAGHLVMVLAYGAFIGLLGEMLRGRNASQIRMALWLVLAYAQLQFFIVAFVAALVFAVVTRKWRPLLAAIVVALPAIVGVIAERGALLRTPYILEWQANQSVYAVPLLTLGGYFAGYADRLGAAAQAAVAVVLAIAVCGVATAYRRRAVLWAAVAAAIVFLIALGVHGPFAVAYAAIVKTIPETGVFRELYDLAGIFTALLLVPAAAAVARYRALQWTALVAAVALPITWLVRPPSDLWVGAASYPHPAIVAPPYARIALLPAFQPMQLRDGRGDGADPDLYEYSNGVAPVNAYFPSYPVDAALARYVERGDSTELAVLGVQRVVDRPWLVSRSNGEVGLAGASLPAATAPNGVYRSRSVYNTAPLVGTCDGARIAGTPNALQACDLFLSDAPGAAPFTVARSSGDSIDPRGAWIDATLAFAREPSLAQGLGGVVTQSRTPLQVVPNAWLLAYARGSLHDARGRTLLEAPGSFAWVWLPASTDRVTCSGICEVVGETRAFPAVALRSSPVPERAVSFDAPAAWLVRVHGASGALLRFNARYDGAWVALAGTRVLPHVRVALVANGWFLPVGRSDVMLVHVATLLQLLAELAGIACTAFLLKALFRHGTKRI
jgi:hypothetical protein